MKIPKKSIYKLPCLTSSSNGFQPPECVVCLIVPSIVIYLPRPQLSSGDGAFTAAPSPPPCRPHRRLVKSKLVPKETFPRKADHNINKELPCASLPLCRRLADRNVADQCSTAILK